MSRDGTGTGPGESRDVGPPTAGERPILPGPRHRRALPALERGGGWTEAPQVGDRTPPCPARRACSSSLWEISAKVPSPPGVRERRVPAVLAGRGTPLLQHNRHRLPSPPSLHCGSRERGADTGGTARGPGAAFPVAEVS